MPATWDQTCLSHWLALAAETGQAVEVIQLPRRAQEALSSSGQVTKSLCGISWTHLEFLRPNLERAGQHGGFGPEEAQCCRSAKVHSMPVKSI